MTTSVDLSKLMVDIRHLLSEITRVQGAIRPLEGLAREKVAREWREISETVNSKLVAAKYFQYDDGLFIKYLSVQYVEVVMVGCFVSIEAFDGLWMDTIGESNSTSQQAYQQAVASVLEEGGMVA